MGGFSGSLRPDLGWVEVIVVTVATPGSFRKETRNALRKYWRRPLKHDFHLIAAEDIFAYQRIIHEYWSEKQDFAIVEPDIVIREDVADAFLNCPCEYGCFPYAWLTDVGPALGCTWFRTSLMERHPEAVAKVMRENVTWRQFDVVLMRHVLAREYGEQPHIHLPAVEHLNEEKKLLPEANPQPLLQVPHW